ncbi:Adenosylcobalamin biosynthesis, ATP:cob(I)alamin adenosyltransferase-like protein [Rozella allomycis CSF55]|uniref:Corrinoid adenosyltransferase MMAB n=1 Tax=Rozella allomycis (strain CSF55) TaxID=988480 RepID=A0A075B5C4_ROZAC|nr:Adenosylcobalamin biosynthesis, ATP:cob(I)alamin adenosyltransferase-like protein [Rozella allomycis CSF55]|eukprot:EPZ36961.1 Adenosylcobalamin biosynthesis, ATP:cob(I)alamin adenosyltransferase-like protein [Rozella allomycis CSF55]
MLSMRAPQVAYKIYTKTGDKGVSSLYSGERRAKTDDIFNALGTSDELSSHIGVALEYCASPDLQELSNRLQKIQCILQEANSVIATPRRHEEGVDKKMEFSPNYTVNLENWIDEMENELPKLTSFILPSGGLASSHLHVCRTVCRRAERMIVHLSSKKECNSDVSIFFNRLSDFLFTAARFACFKSGKKEFIYKK